MNVLTALPASTRMKQVFLSAEIALAVLFLPQMLNRATFVQVAHFPFLVTPNVLHAEEDILHSLQASPSAASAQQVHIRPMALPSAQSVPMEHTLPSVLWTHVLIVEWELFLALRQLSVPNVLRVNITMPTVAPHVLGAQLESIVTRQVLRFARPATQEHFLRHHPHLARIATMDSSPQPAPPNALNANLALCRIRTMIHVRLVLPERTQTRRCQNANPVQVVRSRTRLARMAAIPARPEQQLTKLVRASVILARLVITAQLVQQAVRCVVWAKRQQPAHPRAQIVRRASSLVVLALLSVQTVRQDHLLEHLVIQNAILVISEHSLPAKRPRLVQAVAQAHMPTLLVCQSAWVVQRVHLQTKQGRQVAHLVRQANLLTAHRLRSVQVVKPENLRM